MQATSTTVLIYLCTHLDGIWINKGFWNWGKGFTFLFLESSKIHLPYHPPLCPQPRRRAAVLIPFGSDPICTSSALLCIRPSLLPGWRSWQGGIDLSMTIWSWWAPIGSLPAQLLHIKESAHPRLLANYSFCLRERVRGCLCRLYPSH